MIVRNSWLNESRVSIITRLGLKLEPDTKISGYYNHYYTVTVEEIS